MIPVRRSHSRLRKPKYDYSQKRKESEVEQLILQAQQNHGLQQAFRDGTLWHNQTLRLDQSNHSSLDLITTTQSKNMHSERL